MNNNIIFNWSEEKNLLLKKTRNLSFEDVVVAIEGGDLIDIVSSCSKNHQEQSCFIVKINNYAHIVPYVENEEGIFLKTIYPSRKYKNHLIKMPNKYEKN
jgi:uncharacterized DUF497 family protein